MFTTLVKKEIHQNLLNLRFVVVCFATAALMVGSASVNVSSWLTRSREYSLNRDLIEQSIRDNDRWWSVTERTDALRKPPLLAMFAAGGERDPETQGLICNRIFTAVTCGAQAQRYRQHISADRSNLYRRCRAEPAGYSLVV